MGPDTVQRANDAMDKLFDAALKPVSNVASNVKNVVKQAQSVATPQSIEKALSQVPKPGVSQYDQQIAEQDAFAERSQYDQQIAEQDAFAEPSQQQATPVGETVGMLSATQRMQRYYARRAPSPWQTGEQGSSWMPSGNEQTTNLLDSNATNAQQVLDKVGDIQKQATSMVSEAGGAVSGAISASAAPILAVKDQVFAVAGEAVQGVTAPLRTLTEGVKSVASTPMQAIQGVVGSVGRVVSNVAGTLVSIPAQAASMVTQGLGQVVSGPLKDIQSGLGASLGSVVGPIGNVSNYLNIGETFQQGVQTIGDTMFVSGSTLFMTEQQRMLAEQDAFAEPKISPIPGISTISSNFSNLATTFSQRGLKFL